MRLPNTKEFFLNYKINKSDGKDVDIVNYDHTFVNNKLATIYRVDKYSEFEQMQLDNEVEYPAVVYAKDLDRTTYVEPKYITFKTPRYETITRQLLGIDSETPITKVMLASITNLRNMFLNDVPEMEELGPFDEFEYFTGITSLSGTNRLYKTGFTRIILPESITTIDQDGCAHSPYTSIYIPKNVTSIHARGLVGDSNASRLESMIVDPENTVYYDEENCIYTDTNSKRTLILRAPFAIQPEYKMPDDLIQINQDAMFNPMTLKTLTIGKNLTTWSLQYEAGISIETVVIPNSTFHPNSNFWTNYFSTFSNAYGEGALTRFVVAEDNQYYTAIDDALYTKDGTTLLCYPNQKRGEEIAEGRYKLELDNITLGYRCLAGTHNTDIILGENITAIPQLCFRRAFIINVTIKSPTVVTLGTNAFQYCTPSETYAERGLENIYVPADLVEQYKAATNWVAYKDIIKPIEEV